MVQLVTPDQSAKFAALSTDLPPADSAPPPPLRKVLPAYGKPLLQARRCGEHPSAVTVVYGERWRGVPSPRVCIRPLQYAPGLVDWRVVAGVKVVLLDLADGMSDFDVVANRFGKFYTLIAELVAMDAYVMVRQPDGNAWREEDADALAYACRTPGRWPCWWNDDLNSRQRAAFFAYVEDMERQFRGKIEREKEQ